MHDLPDHELPHYIRARLNRSSMPRSTSSKACVELEPPKPKVVAKPVVQVALAPKLPVAAISDAEISHFVSF